ncbi:MAG TPA: hypothetical protein VEQ37_06195 [Actinomycetota bacterium]|nr:hypothetical protein [Actinomycetota bacterium]
MSLPFLIVEPSATTIPTYTAVMNAARTPRTIDFLTTKSRSYRWYLNTATPTARGIPTPTEMINSVWKITLTGSRRPTLPTTPTSPKKAVTPAASRAHLSC